MKHEFNDSNFNEKYELLLVSSKEDFFNQSLSCDSEKNNIEDDFYKMYQENFSDDEKEPVERIKNRINQGNIREPGTVLGICLTKNESEPKVVGGFVLEYFNKSKCCLLTYLFVGEYKGEGIGKLLIKEGMPLAINKMILAANEYIEDDLNKIEVKAVFFESENPIYTFEKEHSKEDIKTDAIGRLNFFKKMGARWIDIPYVQPKLDKSKNRVYNLLFFILTEISDLSNPFIFDKEVLYEFLEEFYESNADNLNLALSKKTLTSEHYYLNKSSYLNKDYDLDIYRICLAIEVADALEDIDPRSDLNTSQSIELKDLELKIKRQFDDIGDCVRDLQEKYVDIDDQKEAFKVFLENKNDKFKNELKGIENNLKKIMSQAKSLKYNDNDDFYLKEIPQFEEPNFQFFKSGITLHLLRNRDGKKFKQEEETKTEYCPIFNSYEKDLLSLKYHSDETTPCRSKFFFKLPIVITFPYELQFTSEGRRETIYYDVKRDNYAEKVDCTEKQYCYYRKKVNCIISFMKFHNSGIRVWQVVFNNATDDNKKLKGVGSDSIIPLSEYEIIQITKYFSGSQEKSKPQLSFEFESKNKEGNYYKQLNNKVLQKNSPYKKERIEKIFETLNHFSFGENQKKNYEVLAGTIQIDTAYTKIYYTTSQPIPTSSFKPNSFINLFSEDEKNQNTYSPERPPNQVIIDNINKLHEVYLKERISDEKIIDELYGETENYQIHFSDFYKNIRISHIETDVKQHAFQQLYNSNYYLESFMNVICGICLGIFDYGRMGYDEVMDTIKPIRPTNRYFICLNRASIISFGHEEDVFSNAYNNIGISPYLIIPNSVLVNNQRVMQNSERIVNLGIDYLDPKSQKDDISNTDILKSLSDVRDENFQFKEKEILKSDSVGFLSAFLPTTKKIDAYQIKATVKKRVDNLLIHQKIDNIFQYSTEQQLFNYGMEHRDINAIINKVKEGQGELDNQIEDLKDNQRVKYEFFVQILLGMISILQIIDTTLNWFVNTLMLALHSFKLIEGTIFGIPIKDAEELKKSFKFLSVLYSIELIVTVLVLYKLYSYMKWQLKKENLFF